MTNKGDRINITSSKVFNQRRINHLHHISQGLQINEYKSTFTNQDYLSMQMKSLH